MRALSTKEIEWAREKRCMGYTIQQIAEKLNVSERTLQRAFQGCCFRKSLPPLEDPPKDCR